MSNFGGYGRSGMKGLFFPVHTILLWFAYLTDRED